MTANTLLNSQEVRKLPAGALFKAIFVISYISQKSDKNGKPYYDVTATDGLGTVEAKVWSDAQWLDKSEASPQSDDDKLPPERIVQLTGRTVGVNGKVAEYRGLLQFNFNKITLLNQEKYPPAGYLPHSPIPAGELAARFEALVGECQGEAGKFLRFVFGGDRWTRFRDWPAAVSHHHAYANGLLEHTVSVAACAKAMAESMAASGYDVERLCAEYGVALADFEEPELNFGAAMPGLCRALEQAIAENNQQELLEDIEIPLSFVLAQMEHIGFYVDRESIQAYGKELEAQVNQLHDEIIQEVGYEFNINSPKQLGEALFGKLGLPHGKKTKSGWSTNADVLEELRLLHPVVDKVLRYRTVAKLKSTYCDGLLKVIGPDGRVHSTFNQTETRTGRISSTEPNLQNIPVRTPLGRELRKFFAAGRGVLVDADYSQIELRVLAHVADDAAMKEDFLEGRDIHTATAARVFQMPVDMVTKDMRSKAKAVNFGIVYGIGAFSLSKDIGVTRKEADDYIKEYLRNYAGVDAYMKRVVEEAKEKGYVETLFGRRRYLPELKSGNFNLRAFGERVARNMPIQGAAADIIKIAMIRVSSRLAREGLRGKLILQVHDELIVECPPAEREQVERILQEEREGAVRLSVPMVAEAGSGRTWFEAKE